MSFWSSVVALGSPPSRLPVTSSWDCEVWGYSVLGICIGREFLLLPLVSIAYTATDWLAQCLTSLSVALPLRETVTGDRGKFSTTVMVSSGLDLDPPASASLLAVHARPVFLFAHLRPKHWNLVGKGRG